MENEDLLDNLFYALADRRRRHILELLASGPTTVGALAAQLELTVSSASKHIAVLEAGNLILKSRRGRKTYCHLNFDAWGVVTDYIGMHANFWSGRLDELEAHLNKTR